MGTWGREGKKENETETGLYRNIESEPAFYHDPQDSCASSCLRSAKSSLLFYFILLFIFLYSRLLLVIHFIQISVYMSVSITQFITPPPPTPRCFPPLVSIRLFSTSVSPFLPCKPVHLYHFYRFHIYVLIYNICFSPSDLLHSMTASISIQFFTNDSISFLFMAE